MSASKLQPSSKPKKRAQTHDIHTLQPERTIYYQENQASWPSLQSSQSKSKGMQAPPDEQCPEENAKTGQLKLTGSARRGVLASMLNSPARMSTWRIQKRTGQKELNESLTNLLATLFPIPAKVIASILSCLKPSPD